MGSEVTLDADLEDLLVHLRDARGFDFTGYKRPSLARRIDRRMRDLGLDDYQDYRDHLEVHPEEFVALFNTILINVTRFMRDPDAWEAVATRVIPEIVERHAASQQPIRAWSAACSAGQEAYTAVMLFAEALGRSDLSKRLKMYGTDVDEDALDQARQGHYSSHELDNLPSELRERYFTQIGEDEWAFDRELRRSVIFGRHDLVRDAPISRLDLLICRNTLMYFNAEVQADILRRFHFALRDDGHLFLGKAETLLTHNELYEPLELRQRLFRKVSERDLAHAPVPLHHARPGRDDGRDASRADLVIAAFGAASLPQVVLDDRGFVVAANDEARRLFAIRAADLGRPFYDLELSYRPVEFRAVIDTVRNERKRQTVQAVNRDVHESERWFDIEVVPLLDGARGFLGVSITFLDITQHVRLEGELQATNTDLEATSDELRSTNEELETTNEELQSSNEELETTNEELQSSNEELETMNEELQSTNSELERLNEMLHERSREADEANAYLRSILRSLDVAVVVVDETLAVRTWNERAHEQWGLRADEVSGSNLLGLDLGLPVEELRGIVTGAVEHGEAGTVEVDAYDRRGNPVRCHVRSVPLGGPSDGVRGCVLLLETRPRG